MSRTFVAGLVASTSLLAISGTAFAQTNAQVDQRARAAADPNAEAPAAGTAASDADVVVTGSRVIQNGNNSPTPLTVIAPDSLKAVTPGNLAESLNILPVFSGSRSQNSNTGTSGAAGSPATSTNAVNVINLRNMGLARTLILYDGHRAPPSTPEGFVDVNTIPQLLLKRVDVVTGGVSAVYGSDGITGVVNFVTDTGFKGVKAEAQYGISQYGDAPGYEVGIAGGTDLLDGRIHVMASYNRRDEKGIFSKFARDWGSDVRTLQGSGTAAYPYFQVIGARQNNVTFAGRINNGALADQQFTTGGTSLTPFVHGAKTGQGGTIPPGSAYEIGGDGAYYDGQLRASLELNQFYGRVDYDVTDGIKFYVSGAYTDNHSLGVQNYYVQQNLQIQRSNAFLPAAVVAGLGAATTFNLGKVFSEVPRGELEAKSRQTLVTTGFKGSFGGGWNWEAAYILGRAKFDVNYNNAINQGNFAAAIDSVVSNGATVCRASLTNAAYSGCVPFNPFGVNRNQQAAIDYITDTIGWQTTLNSDDFVANVSGSPFSTWAGPVRFAVSGEWRKVSESITSNSLPSSRANCTGILGNCNANTVSYNVSVAPLPKTSSTVKEIAGEVLIPLLRDSGIARTLDLNLAYRHADYDLVGQANTYKIGLTWQPIDAVTFRGTYSRDFRAPTIDELFRRETFSLTNFTDRITGADVSTSNVPTRNYGNANLKPEIAHTITAGVVIKPLSNFSVALDYFNIKIDNAIFLIQGNSTEPQDVCYASKGTSSYCALIVRGLGIYDPTAPNALSVANAVTEWRQQPLNIARQSTWGFDFEANYRTDLFGRPLGLRLLTTYQPHIRVEQPGVVTNDYGGVAFGTNGIQATPKWRVSGFVNIQPADNITISILERWRSSLAFHSNPLVVVASPKIKSVGYTNLNVAFDIPNGRSGMQFFANVSNLFNVTPPQAGFWGNPNPGQFGEFVLGDDVIGRAFTVGVKVKL